MGEASTHTNAFATAITGAASISPVGEAAIYQRQSNSSATGHVPLRIMPLGASVTFGVGSTTGDSYRKDLLDLLAAANKTANYVGEKKNGNFANNAVEAVPGFVIDQIAGLVSSSVPRLLPNLVLVDAGTNNCNQGGTVPDAGANVTAMLNNIFALSPGTTAILATLLVNKVANQDACRVDVNRQYTELSQTLRGRGAKLVLVDMRGPGGPTTANLNDTRHPNDAGYVKMANIWFAGIQEAISQGFISAPAGTGNPANSSSPSPPKGQTSPLVVATSGATPELGFAWSSSALVLTSLVYCVLFSFSH